MPVPVPMSTNWSFYISCGWQQSDSKTACTKTEGILFLDKQSLKL